MCNLLKIKHVGESDKLPCPMTLEKCTHVQASPPAILIKFFESLQSDDGANHDKSQQQFAVKLCRQQVHVRCYWPWTRRLALQGRSALRCY